MSVGSGILVHWQAPQRGVSLSAHCYREVGDASVPVAVHYHVRQHLIYSAAADPNNCGDVNPVTFNDTAEGRAQNRRVELTLANLGK